MHDEQGFVDYYNEQERKRKVIDEKIGAARFKLAVCRKMFELNRHKKLLSLGSCCVKSLYETAEELINRKKERK